MYIGEEVYQKVLYSIKICNALKKYVHRGTSPTRESIRNHMGGRSTLGTGGLYVGDLHGESP